MAFRIDKAIVRGEITNEVPGVVTGRIWLEGRREPLVLELEGNCLPDLAGCAVVFENPHPEPENLDGLIPLQKGSAGQMTASYKAKIPAVTDEELADLIRHQLPIPGVFANCLYLEWYSDLNGRVVIETNSCTVSVSEPRWLLPEETRRSGSESEGSVSKDTPSRRRGESDFNSRASDAATGAGDPYGLYSGFRSPFESDDDDSDDEEFCDDDWDDEDDEPLNEFEWELELREADEKVDVYQAALERFREYLDQQEECESHRESEPNEMADPFADPADERDNLGRTPDAGHLRHYLTTRALELAATLQRGAERKDLIALEDAGRDDPGNPVFLAIASTIQLGENLGSALDGIANGVEPEPGFVIAMLKRALPPLNEAIHGCGEAIERYRSCPTAYSWLTEARDELFDLRKEILDFMEELRQDC